MQKREKTYTRIVDEDGNVTLMGAVRNGVDEKTANHIFDEMMDFASYAFNKSHAAAYAVVAYQTAWLKYYYPIEFMAATLNSFLGSAEKVSRYVHECKQTGIDVLPPDVNESDVRFTVVQKLGWHGCCKEVGRGCRSLKEREHGPFKIVDFCKIAVRL